MNDDAPERAGEPGEKSSRPERVRDGAAPSEGARPEPAPAAAQPGPPPTSSGAEPEPPTLSAVKPPEPSTDVTPAASAPPPAEPTPPIPVPARRESRPVRPSWTRALEEPEEIPSEVPRRRLAAQSRRDFLLFTAASAAAAIGAWWL